MGKAKSRKFLGSVARSNPTSNLTVVCNEEELENAGEDVWQRISQQLQSGKFYFSSQYIPYILVNYALTTYFRIL